MSIFKTPEHAKSVTKALHSFMKANPKAKLSEFRQELADKTGKASFHDFLNSVNNCSNNNVQQISLLELFSKDFLCIANNENIAQFFFDVSHLCINYEGNINKHGIATESYSLEIPYYNLKSAKISGNQVILSDSYDEDINLRFYLPMNEKNLDIQTESDIIVVKTIVDHTIENQVSFINNSNGEKAAFKAFVKMLEATISNFDEYSQEDLEALWEQGGERFGSGEIVIAYELDNVEKQEEKEMQLAFDIISASVSQRISITDPNFNEDTIISGLIDGSIVTTTWHGDDYEAELTTVEGHVIGRVVSQEIEGEYNDFR